jgi:hypothetical protein
VDSRFALDDVEERTFLTLSGLDHLVVQAVVSRYITYAIPALHVFQYNMNIAQMDVPSRLDELYEAVIRLKFTCFQDMNAVKSNWFCIYMLSSCPKLRA